MSVEYFIGFLVLVLLVVGLWIVALYNRLARGRIRAGNSLSQIDVQLKRRCDLIPNLVEAVKGYMAHERQTLEAVITARNSAVAGLSALSAAPRDAVVIRAVAGASGALDQLLMRLSISIEKYPDLKASTNVLGLQEELVSTENRIAFARQSYNDSVMTFNTNIATFPSSLVAAMFAFRSMTLFEADSASRLVPEVRF
ncbi:MAG: LemA family protein [Phycisphaerales bacterium]|nr:LemA family protein [Phycisphaerales bacterium]